MLWCPLWSAWQGLAWVPVFVLPNALPPETPRAGRTGRVGCGQQARAIEDSVLITVHC